MADPNPSTSDDLHITTQISREVIDPRLSSSADSMERSLEDVFALAVDNDDEDHAIRLLNVPERTNKKRLSSGALKHETAKTLDDSATAITPPAFAGKVRAARHANHDDEAMAASALVSMYDDSLHDEKPQIKGIFSQDSTTGEARRKPAAKTKNKNKTVTALCYECGIEQTSHFRPVVSDFIGKKSKTSEVFPRVEVCNKCYCKMAPRLSEYSAWRLGMLKKQVSLYSDHGIHEFDISRDGVNSRKGVGETLMLLEEIQTASKSGGQIGTLRVRPIIGKR